jgi:oxalate---CoA ligase
LIEFGLGRGDRIALVLRNGPDMGAAFLGVAGSAVCAPLNPVIAPRNSIFTCPTWR